MNPIRRAALAVAAIAALTPAAAALARTPYLLPNSFNPDGRQVTLVGATTEDDYFNPDGALNAPAFQVTAPSGAQSKLAPAAAAKALTVVEAPMEAAGTYRITTGPMIGRKQTFVQVGGKWLIVRQPRAPRPGEAPAPAPAPAPGAPRPPGPPGGGEEGPPGIQQADVPAGAPSMEVDNVQIVETYVSKGAPSDTALKTSGQGFELKPVTHPNSVYVDQGFAFQLLIDGKPVEGAPIAVYRSGNIYDDRRIAFETRSDAKGMAKVSFAQPGVYLLTTRSPQSPRQPGEPPPAHNYTYSITFEVTR